MRTNPNRKYSSADVKLLEKTDEVHLRLSSLTTKEIMRREVEVFGRDKYRTISQVSTSHLHNLRTHPVYRNSYFNHTQPVSVPIGSCEKPDPEGKPGTIRADTVHQTDIYYLNVVDEVTQWEVVVCVPYITDVFMEIALREILDQCPFCITGFHSDRGGEFINRLMEEAFRRLRIRQTKSRPRRSNDNALVETKNGSVIRKNFGWEHRNQGDCDAINKYLREWFNPYLNYHRPSLFVTDIVKTKKGRTRKVYGEAAVPYEKLKQVSQEQHTNFLKKRVTFAQLDKFAYQMSDNEFATLMREQERKLYVKLNRSTTPLGGLRKNTKP